MKILIVVDMQEDFVNGPLGTPEAKHIVPEVITKIKMYNANNDLVLYTADTHNDNYLETQEGRKLPVPHCIPCTNGYRIVKDIQNAVPILASHIIMKESFGTIAWENVLRENVENEWRHTLVPKADCLDFESFYQHKIGANGEKLEIEIIGVCTDICVVSNALILKAIYPEAEISVDTHCCAGTTPDNHKAALQVMGCCQINVKE